MTNLSSKDKSSPILEERKLKEIEHSKQIRSILQGYERKIDTNKKEQIENAGDFILDKENFEYHWSNIKFYSINNLSETYQYDFLKKHCNSSTKILDFACGNGENGIYAAECGADVIGIDISPEGVENANRNAKDKRVDSHCKFKVMDGENMDFEDSYFDLAVEYGALHHVELDTALNELSRVLKSNGKIICVEALRHNPLIHSYRRRTPHLRTEWEYEHILGVESLEYFKKYFVNVDVKFFHLAVLAAVPFRKTILFKPLKAFLNFIDKIILSNKIISKYAWIMIVTAEKK
jgi:ubiquinone/menaquinone biosynthesis C-methylase UbiE